jgi:hypothetical protein
MVGWAAGIVRLVTVICPPIEPLPAAPSDVIRVGRPGSHHRGSSAHHTLEEDLCR